MSTRYMRKVYGTDSIPKAKESGDSSDNEETIIGVKHKNFNTFSLLNCLDSEEDEDQDNSNDDNEVDNEIEGQEEKEEAEQEVKVKSKKKKRHRKTRNKNSRKSSEESSEVVDFDEDEVERSVREVNRILGEPAPSSSQESDENSKAFVLKSKHEILRVQHKTLNPFNELKKIFGSKTVQEAENLQTVRRRNLKKNWLIFPRKQWPPTPKEMLSMSFDRSMDSKDGFQYFVYEHGETYRKDQLEFFKAVNSYDPENVQNFVQLHPYHVESAIQLADIYKINEDFRVSARLIEKALYTLECAFHPLFNMTTGNCRLDYRKEQNRALFITLFKHLTFVGGRAGYRTSLELCKFLLSLEPEDDPLAVVLMMDYYALKAREYKWFIEFCSLWESSRNLTQLPNVAYGLALAYFRLGEEENANEHLQNALLMFPGMLIPLLEKCSIQPDSRVQDHDFFNYTAESSTPPSLEKLQYLYITRSYHLWKQAEILPWLEKAAQSVLDRVDARDEFAKFGIKKRKERYRGKMPRNILRHILLADLHNLTIAAMEDSDESESILAYDPLPPLDSINIYSRSRSSNAREGDVNTNFFAAFFSSIFRHQNIRDAFGPQWPAPPAEE